MTDYYCESCEFFEDKSTDKLIDGYCKKYNQSLNFYDWWEKCDKCIIETLQAENAALRARLGKFDDLHIHMGEKVYIIADDNEIIERFICGVHILSTEIIFVTTTQKNYKSCNKKGIAAHITHAFENSFGLISLRDFGERAFIHRESALARLAELKGEEKQ